MPASFGFEDDIVVLPGFLFFVDDIRLRFIDGDLVSPATKGVLAAELSVKISGSLRQRLGIRLIIHIKILVMHLSALVNQFDQGAFAEWHLNIAVERTTLVKFVLVLRLYGCAKKCRLIRVHDAVSQAKKVPERRKHRRRSSVIPGDTQQTLAVMIALGQPQVGNTARTFQIRQNTGLAWRDFPGILITSTDIPRGYAPGAGSLQKSQLWVHGCSLEEII